MLRLGNLNWDFHPSTLISAPRYIVTLTLQKGNYMICIRAYHSIRSTWFGSKHPVNLLLDFSQILDGDTSALKKTRMQTQEIIIKLKEMNGLSGFLFR